MKFIWNTGTWKERKPFKIKSYSDSSIGVELHYTCSNNLTMELPKMFNLNDISKFKIFFGVLYAFFQEVVVLYFLIIIFLLQRPRIYLVWYRSSPSFLPNPNYRPRWSLGRTGSRTCWHCYTTKKCKPGPSNTRLHTVFCSVWRTRE